METIDTLIQRIRTQLQLQAAMRDWYVLVGKGAFDDFLLEDLLDKEKDK